MLFFLPAPIFHTFCSQAARLQVIVILDFRVFQELVHGQVTIIFVVSVCLFVCLCRVFFSGLRSNLHQTRTHVTCPGLVVSPRI